VRPPGRQQTLEPMGNHRKLPDAAAAETVNFDAGGGQRGQTRGRFSRRLRPEAIDDRAEAAAIDPRGFLHTGDLATMDERGYVRIVGRSKDMLIVGGFNVYPAEVENTLLGHEAIRGVAVVGLPDRRLGEVPVAYVVPTPGESLDADAIIRWARARLANYKLPRHVVEVAELPVNATGKVVKEELRARARAELGD